MSDKQAEEFNNCDDVARWLDTRRPSITDILISVLREQSFEQRSQSFVFLAFWNKVRAAHAARLRDHEQDRKVDLLVSRRLQKIMRSVQRLIVQEIGEEFGATLILQAYAKDIADQVTQRELQYISTMDRQHMVEAMRGLLQSWSAGTPDVPYHNQT